MHDEDLLISSYEHKETSLFIFIQLFLLNRNKQIYLVKLCEILRNPVAEKLIFLFKYCNFVLILKLLINEYVWKNLC